MHLVDSHCHLPLIETAEPDGLSGLLARARESAVVHMLCVGVDLESIDAVLEIAATHPAIAASVGVHPNAEPGQCTEPTAAHLDKLASRSEVVAIGETGLDYYRLQGDPECQHTRFRTQIRAAREMHLPLIIHTRDAAPHTLKILREENAAEVGGVMHCFVDDWDTASAAMDLGFYISFSGIVTFRNATALQEVARRVPDERLLIETDAPWLAPEPRRGKQNEPAYVRHTAEFLAQLRDQSLPAIAATTTNNYFRLFHEEAESPYS